MKRAAILLLGVAASGCGQEANQTAAKPAVAKPRQAYCFFKDPDTKGWTARRDAKGDIVVIGRAYRQDPRYMATIGKTEIVGDRAEVWPTIKLNDTGFAAPDNWWKVSATISGTAAVTTVAVRCGAKAFAELKVATKA